MKDLFPGEKKKMQNVSFNSVQELLDFLQGEELLMTEKLRDLVFECIPGIKEKLSFNVPFYNKYRSICFIWPGSVSWGKVTNKGVRLGFSSGHLLEDDSNYLGKGNRKMIYWKDFHALKDIDENIVRAFLLDAAALDNEKAMAAKSKKRTRK